MIQTIIIIVVMAWVAFIIISTRFFIKGGKTKAQTKVVNLKVNEKPGDLMIQYADFYRNHMLETKKYSVTIRIEEL